MLLLQQLVVIKMTKEKMILRRKQLLDKIGIGLETVFRIV